MLHNKILEKKRKREQHRQSKKINYLQEKTDQVSDSHGYHYLKQTVEFCSYFVTVHFCTINVLPH